MSVLVAENMSFLRAAMDTELIPKAVQEDRAFFVVRGGEVYVKPGGRWPRGLKKKVREAGFEVIKDLPEGAREVECWPQIIPMQHVQIPDPIGEALFLGDAEDGFLRVAAELLRLGCDRQELCFFEHDGVRRCAVRAIDPPYYSMLKSLEMDVEAFLPIHPNAQAYVHAGFSHPLVEKAHVHDDEILLVSKTGIWSTIPNGPWTDIYQLTDFKTPHATGLKSVDPKKRLLVELKLVRGPTMHPPSLWVLHDNALVQMERLVRTLPEGEIGRLNFAAAGEPSDPIVVLKARRSEKGPPAIDVYGQGYVPLMEIPNIFVPHGKIVDPPIRQNRLRDLFNSNQNTIAWLSPIDEQNFVVEKISDSGFRPLREWVDYLIHANKEKIKPWTRCVELGFERFVANDLEFQKRPKEEASSKKKARPKRSPQHPEIDENFDDDDNDHDINVGVVGKFELPKIETSPSEQEEMCARAEREFCELDTPLDDYGRIPKWVELSFYNRALGRDRDADLCIGRALWETRDEESAGTIAKSWMTEKVDFKKDEITPAEARMFAAQVICEELNGVEFCAPLHEIQKFFIDNESALDIRTLWLVRCSLSRRSGGDTLSLFQTRDEIASRCRGGVPLAQNIPTFIRMYNGDGVEAGASSMLSNQLLNVLTEFTQTKRSRSQMEADENLTSSYVRYLFSWGLAKLGQPELSSENRLLAESNLEGVKEDPVHHLCMMAFNSKIEQAMEGMPVGTSLPIEYVQARQDMGRFERYKADRLLQASRVLDPRGDFDPFQAYRSKTGNTKDPAFDAFSNVESINDLESLIGDVIAIARSEEGRRVKLIDGVVGYLSAIPIASGLGHMKDVVELAKTVPADELPKILENILICAGHFDRSDMIFDMLNMVENVSSQVGPKDPAVVASLLSRCGPVLKRFGQKESVSKILDSLQGSITGDGASVIKNRLRVASARASLGDFDSVKTEFSQAHDALQNLRADERLDVIREMALAVNRTDAPTAISASQSLIQFLPSITDSFNTNTHFCLSVIHFMESCMLTLASEDITISDWARRWIEEDEHLLHRRIHKDLTDI